MGSIIESWEREERPHATRLRALYEFLSKHLFDQYEPSKRISTSASYQFLAKLEAWLGCFSNDQDRWNAFRSLEYFFFVGKDEFEELYRCSCDHVLLPWLADLAKIDIFSDRADELLWRELARTWVCPVTDSLRINSYLHVTGIPGLSYRPDWRSLSELADPRKIANLVSRSGIKRLVLVEDFVGSGRQFGKALSFAARNFSGDILAMPLVICAPGDHKLRQIVKEFPRKNIQYFPQVVLPEYCLVQRTPHPDEPKLFEDLRRSLFNGYISLGSPNIDGKELGFGEVGSLLCMFSNCPNNTPPIYHYPFRNWKAIFPRAGRK